MRHFRHRGAPSAYHSMSCKYLKLFTKVDPNKANSRNIVSFWETLSPRLPTWAAPGPHWGTSVPQTLYTGPSPASKSRLRPWIRGKTTHIVKLAVSRGKRNVSLWRPSVRPSVCLSRLFSNLNRTRGSYSTWLTFDLLTPNERIFMTRRS